MTPTLRRKLEALAERREELERLLADPGVIGDSERFRNFSREFSQLEPVATAMAEEKRAQADLAAAQAMRGDPELAELADEEIAAAQQRLAQSGYFESVFVYVDPVSEAQTSPVVVQVRETKRKMLVLGVGGSTDKGARLSIEHTHHRVPGWTRSRAVLSPQGCHPTR